MSNVFRLAYVDLATPAPDEARQYYEAVLGLSPTEQTADCTFLSLGLDHHNLALHRADREGLTAIGLHLSGDILLADLAARLRAMGYAAEQRSDARPGVASLIDVPDIGGHRFQLIADMTTPAPGFAGRGVAPVRLGHVAVLSPDTPNLLRFLDEALGFITTDWFEEQVTFVTCNQDHHVLNIAAAPVATMHHLAFQLSGAEHQVRAADHLARHDVPTLWGPARHTAGHNIASYHHGADGALVELYNDMDVFVPALGWCDPRPWHDDLPQRPKRWPLSDMTEWQTRYEFSFAEVTFGMTN